MDGQGTRSVLRVGDRVAFDGGEHTVAGLAGTRVRLVSTSGQPCVVLLPHLLASPGFALLDSDHPRFGGLAPLGLLESLPAAVVDRACWWERHVIEVETGLPPDAPPGASPRPEFDPHRRTVRQREAAKAAELTAAGQPTSAVTVQRMRHRYRTRGLWGLVDQRLLPHANPLGRADRRLVAAITAAIEAETSRSTGTKTRLRRRVEQALAAEHGPGVVPMPSVATFNRLVAVLAAGRETFGSAVRRRQLAGRPHAPFTPTVAARPGEQVQIDTTPLDVRAVLDNGMPDRVELTIAVDVATRTICAAILRPAGTKAVDAALLLARMLVPEPMRPGWPEALAMAHSQIPYQRLLSLDARLEQAAAKPVIVPDTIVCDRHRVFLSATFLSACRMLGISVQPARPQTPTDKSVIERTFESVNTLFCQHVRGYVGSDVTRRGADADIDAVWTLPQLQELLDEWIVACWQPRLHEGLRHPLAPGAPLSPNEAYAALVAAAGYVPVALSGDDYVELLPVVWRQVNDYGIQLDYRTYDAVELGAYRRQPSPVAGRRGRWEVHYDPYDLSHVWVRRPEPEGGFVTAAWTHLPMVQAPFADFIWRQARKLAAQRGADDRNQTIVARIVEELLDRAEAGPTPDSRAAARSRAAAAVPLRPAPISDPDGAGDDADDGDTQDAEGLAEAEVVPFGMFDPDSELGPGSMIGPR